MTEDDYGVSSTKDSPRVEAPDLDYLPPRPRTSDAVIGLIGTGGISEFHLKAYARMGLKVAALCDPAVERAEDKRRRFFPHAAVYSDHRELLARDDLTVVQAATHPDVSPRLVEDALASGRHVLSQKPFVTDIRDGRSLAQLAERPRPPPRRQPERPLGPALPIHHPRHRSGPHRSRHHHRCRHAVGPDLGRRP